MALTGVYRIALHRRPGESDLGLRERGPGDQGQQESERARLYPGGTRGWTAGEDPAGFPGLVGTVGEGDAEVAFTLELPRGSLGLHAWFEGRDLAPGACCSAE